MIQHVIDGWVRSGFAEQVTRKSGYFAGLDLGQARDFTALAVIERVEVLGERNPATYEYARARRLRLRYMERMPLGTSYPEVIERVRTVMRSSALSDGRRYLAVDGTGVGRPVVDSLERSDLGCRLMPATITSGDTERYVDDYYRVPKRDLISGLQLLLQNGELQIAGGLKESEVLLREMAAMRVEIKLRNEEYDSWREREHDDLVLAVALACWAVGKY